MDKNMEQFTNYISEIVSFVAGLAGGALFTLKVTKKSTGKASTMVDQSGSTVGRDQTGISGARESRRR